MLYKIIIENFFSIADRQEIIFNVPRNTPDLPCFRSSDRDKNARLPAVIGFFGPNASGKSTVLRAVVSVLFFAGYGMESGQGNLKALFQAYRQKNWLEKPIKIMLEFENSFKNNDPLALFRYEIHINPHYNIAYETLHYASKGKFRCLFKRENQTFHFGEKLKHLNKKNDPRKESIRPDASVISTLSYFNDPFFVYFCNSIKGIFTTNHIGVINIQKQPSWLELYHKNELLRNELNKTLMRLDVGLESMHIEQGSQGLFPKFEHTGLDGSIFFQEESRGTQHFIEIFHHLYFALQKGRLAVIDELDADTHPLLLPELFRWFEDPKKNPHGAQLLFTAHNPALLDDLQKEQVFLTEKPLGKPTSVYGVRDIKGLRREPSLMKKYLAGELGAVPHIG